MKKKRKTGLMVRRVKPKAKSKRVTGKSRRVVLRAHEDPANRLPNGRFRRGHPPTPGGGNPALAMQKALRDAITGAIRPEELADCLRRLLRLARKGDRQAIEALLNQVAGKPAKRPQDFAVTLPDIKEPKDIIRGMSALVDALKAGTLTTEQAQAVSAVLENARKAMETCELEDLLLMLKKELPGREVQ